MKKMARHLNPPIQCDVCHSQINNVFYDAMTAYGPWANLCTNCFNTIGIGLGTGLGQMYRKQKDGTYLKVEG